MRHRAARRHARPSPRRRIVLGSLLALGVVAAAGTANAFWTAHGDGDGSAVTGTAAVVTLGPAAPSSELHPGGAADVGLTISNPGTATVHIDALELDDTEGTGGFSTDGAHPGCDTSALTFTTATNGGLGWTVPGGDGKVDGSLSVTLPDAVSMALDAAQQCQGADFIVYLEASQ